MQTEKIEEHMANIEALQVCIADKKELEKLEKEYRQALTDLMVEDDIKKFEQDGYVVALRPATPSKTVYETDFKALILDYPIFNTKYQTIKTGLWSKGDIKIKKLVK